MAVGGSHPGFGTHNRLLRLGADCYLELIARDPEQPEASRVLFGLDQEPVARALAGSPHLLHAVFRVTQPASLAAVLPQLAYDPGALTRMTRGQLAWDITVPRDGHPDGNGLLPTLIDWGATAHPCTRLPDSGVVLEALRFEGPSAVIARFPACEARGTQIKLALRQAPCSTISADFVVADKRIIIQSRLPVRGLA